MMCLSGGGLHSVMGRWGSTHRLHYLDQVGTPGACCFSASGAGGSGGGSWSGFDTFVGAAIGACGRVVLCQPRCKFALLGCMCWPPESAVCRTVCPPPHPLPVPAGCAVRQGFPILRQGGHPTRLQVEFRSLRSQRSLPNPIRTYRLSFCSARHACRAWQPTATHAGLHSETSAAVPAFATLVKPHRPVDRPVGLTSMNVYPWPHQLSTLVNAP